MLNVSGQALVDQWMRATFPDAVRKDPVERGYRLLEETLELVQAMGVERSRAFELVSYVFDRPAGDPVREVGDVQITLAALANVADADMDAAFLNALSLCWRHREKIRAKHFRKPVLSALPGADDQAKSPPVRRNTMKIVDISERKRRAPYAISRVVTFEYVDAYGATRYVLICENPNGYVGTESAPTRESANQVRWRILGIPDDPEDNDGDD